MSQSAETYGMGAPMLDTAVDTAADVTSLLIANAALLTLSLTAARDAWNHGRLGSPGGPRSSALPRHGVTASLAADQGRSLPCSAQLLPRVSY